MMGILFEPTHHKLDALPVFDRETIIKEPMFFQASANFAYDNGGPITREFLGGAEWKDYVVDSRVHMLKPGWYPCIPGWHIDGLRRPDGQPDYENIPEDDDHILSVIGPTAHTQFLDGPVNLHKPYDEQVYKSFSRQIDLQIEAGIVSPVQYENASVIRFGPTDFHRGVRADRDGWRFFIRASKDGSRPQNKMRTQVQVYLPTVDMGW